LKRLAVIKANVDSVDYSLVRAFALIMSLTSFPAWPANAQSISVPAYNPPIGRETAFHVELEITTEQRGSDPLAPGTARGDFVDRLTVQERTSDGFHMLWQFDAALPPAAHGREIEYPINSTFQEAIGLFGVDGLNVDTDLAGNPKSVFGADLIINNMRIRADESRGPDALTIRRLARSCRSACRPRLWVILRSWCSDWFRPHACWPRRKRIRFARICAWARPRPMMSRCRSAVSPHLGC
jgi:hypothetical protein